MILIRAGRVLGPAEELDIKADVVLDGDRIAGIFPADQGGAEGAPGFTFAGSINSPESVDRGYLTQTEIQTLMDAPMKNATHELVRDLFVFSVFTGLAYSDVKNLTTDRLQTFFDGNLWIITRRKKVNGQLVMLGFGISTFTPASYQRHRL